MKHYFTQYFSYLGAKSFPLIWAPDSTWHLSEMHTHNWRQALSLLNQVCLWFTENGVQRRQKFKGMIYGLLSTVCCTDKFFFDFLNFFVKLTWNEVYLHKKIRRFLFFECFFFFFFNWNHLSFFLLNSSINFCVHFFMQNIF